MNHASIAAALALVDAARNRLMTGSKYGDDMESSRDLCAKDAIELLEQAISLLKESRK